MADVKFSELASLAAADVASADVLAIVDTDASTSKKLSIDNLFGSIPVNVLQTDATDATSSAGAVRTAGGVSMAKKLWVGTTSTLTGAVTATAGVFPAAQDGAALGSSSLQWADLFLADAGTITMGDDGDTTLTHVADTGVLLNSTRQLQFGDSASYVAQSSDGVLRIDGEATVDINASTAVLVSNDLKLDSDASVLGFGVDNDVTLTHVADTGLLLNGTMQLQFNDSSQTISSTGVILSIAATDEIDLTATAIDINGTVDISGLAVLSANTTIGAGAAGVDYTLTFNGETGDGVITWAEDEDYFTFSDDVLMSTTEKVQFHDTAQYINAPADARLAIVSDGDIELTATDIKVGLASQDANIQALTDVFDMTLKQFDGNEVARVHDGARAATLDTGTLDLTAGAAGKGGFGFKRPVYNLTPASDDQECTLTMAHSGSIIMVTGAAHDLDIALPAIAAGDEGFHITIVITTAFSGTNNMEVKTSGDSGDTIHLYSNDAGTTAADVAGGDVVRTQADPVAGTKLEFTCLKGGAAEQWICEAIVPSGDAPTVEAAVA